MAFRFRWWSHGSLPDNVVEALSQWRYRAAKAQGSGGAFKAVLTVPVRRAIDRQVEWSLRRTWHAGSKELRDAIEAGAKLDAAGAAQLEQNLPPESASQNARTTLLSYLAGAPAAANPEEIRKARARHIAWFVETWPEAPILDSPFVIINAAAEPLADRAAYEHVRELWLQQLARDPASQTILAHATNFLRIADPEKIEPLLLEGAKKSRAAAVWLGDFYGLAALGVTGLDPKTGLPSSAGERLPETAFSRRARTILKGTNDARVLLSGVAAFTAGGRSLANLGRRPEGYAALCQELLDRAKALYPAASAVCEGSAAPAPQAPLKIRVGGNVQQAKLLKQARPAYPQEAKSRGIQGAVRFEATIDKTGSIRKLEMVSGPLALYPAARDAVAQWKYTPTLLNGDPVEVLTAIDVNYTLGR